MSDMKISICSASYGRADLFTIADRLAAHGFDGIEITVMYHADPDQTSAQQRREIRRRLEQCGLAISGLHFIFGPGLKMAADDAPERARVTAHIDKVSELAHDLGAPIIVVGGGGVRSVPATLDRAIGEQRVIEVLGNSARRAEQLGVAIGLEAINRYETNLGRTLADCRRFVQAIGSPAMKVVGDTFHMNIEEASMAEAIRNAGPLLGHLQLEDSHRLSPGDGHIDFPPIIEALRQIGYQGYLSFEFFWIAPELLYLPTFEACDAEAARGLKSMRSLLRVASAKAA